MPRKKTAAQLNREIAEALVEGSLRTDLHRVTLGPQARNIGEQSRAVTPARTKEPKRLPIPLPFERKPQIPSRWSDWYRKERVPIDRMIATQHHVTAKGLRQYRLTSPKHDIDLPIVYRTDDGRLYIADGHHRIVAAIKRGEQSIMARVIDIGDPDNPREPPW